MCKSSPADWLIFGSYLLLYSKKAKIVMREIEIADAETIQVTVLVARSE